MRTWTVNYTADVGQMAQYQVGLGSGGATVYAEDAPTAVLRALEALQVVCVAPDRITNLTITRLP